MKNTHFLHSAILVSALAIASCGGSTTSSTSDSDSTVAAAQPATKVSASSWELLLAVNKEWLKTSDGEVFYQLVQGEIPGLPQVESCFRITTVNPRALTDGNTFKTYPNILIAEINKAYPEPKMTRALNVYSNPQIVITVTAPSTQSLIMFMADNQQVILDQLVNFQLDNARKFLQKNHSGIVTKAAREMFKHDIYAPLELNAIKRGKDFFWASSEGKHEQNLNLCMYSYPYTSSSTFTLDYAIEKRDSFMRHNVVGETPEEYMATDRITVTERNISVGGHYVHEVRGLWQMENAPMGGPFISYSQVDTLTNRVIVVEGFVYAPEKKKRELIRDLEAALGTLVKI